MNANLQKSSFVPTLIIPSGTFSIDFYNYAFGAVTLRHWNNEDGSIHVAELLIGEAMFRLHEENPSKGAIAPVKNNSFTAIIGITVDHVDNAMAKVISSGAILISPAQDYDYGYRQGEVMDPFGHHWMIEQALVK